MQVYSLSEVASKVCLLMKESIDTDTKLSWASELIQSYASRCRDSEELGNLKTQLKDRK